jgi:hypothetical protein
MIRSHSAGTTLRLLCLPLSVALLSSCERQSRRLDVEHDLKELHADIDGIKKSPSLQPGSGQAGPPIHVDPYPHSAGMSHRHDAPHH